MGGSELSIAETKEIATLEMRGELEGAMEAFFTGVAKGDFPEPGPALSAKAVEFITTMDYLVKSGKIAIIPYSPWAPGGASQVAHEKAWEAGGAARVAMEKSWEAGGAHRMSWEAGGASRVASEKSWEAGGVSRVAREKAVKEGRRRGIGPGVGAMGESFADGGTHAASWAENGNARKAHAEHVLAGALQARHLRGGEHKCGRCVAEGRGERPGGEKGRQCTYRGPPPPNSMAKNPRGTQCTGHYGCDCRKRVATCKHFVEPPAAADAASASTL